MQASIRKTDRAVIQLGRSLGDRDDCVVEEITAQQEIDLRAAFNQPHTLVFFSSAGVTTHDAPPLPPGPALDQVAFDAAAAQLRATFNTPRTALQINNSIDALTVLLRRAYRELQ